MLATDNLIGWTEAIDGILLIHVPDVASIIAETGNIWGLPLTAAASAALLEIVRVSAGRTLAAARASGADDTAKRKRPTL